MSNSGVILPDDSLPPIGEDLLENKAFWTFLDGGKVADVDFQKMLLSNSHLIISRDYADHQENKAFNFFTWEFTLRLCSMHHVRIPLRREKNLDQKSVFPLEIRVCLPVRESRASSSEGSWESSMHHHVPGCHRKLLESCVFHICHQDCCDVQTYLCSYRYSVAYTRLTALSLMPLTWAPITDPAKATVSQERVVLKDIQEFLLLSLLEKKPHLCQDCG